MEAAQEAIQNSTWQKISDLESLLKTNDPRIAGHLKAIHATLIQYEELVHLLSDDQIREMMLAQSAVTGTVLVQKVVKSSSASITKQAKNISLDDL